MSRRGASRLAWSIWAAAIGLTAAGLLLGWTNRPEVELYEFWFEPAIGAPVFASLGVLIASRRPENSLGWLFLTVSVLAGTQLLSGEYAMIALHPTGPDLEGGATAAWLSNLVQLTNVVSWLFLVLLFPSGRLLSRPARVVAVGAALATATALVSLAFTPGPLENFPSTQNPYGIEGPGDFLGALGGVAGIAAAMLSVVAVGLLVTRFVRSRGEERLQLKWFAYAAVLGISLIMFVGERFGTFAWTVGPLGLPVAAAVAILRYRLYDIDRIINRTLVYGALTAMLALLYVVGVFGSGGLFGSVVETNNSLVVAATTLAAAALFRPARSVVQSFIDRRFYRSKYDAAQTLEAFSARLRDEIDLDELSTALLGAVEETMAPSHASLWLREAGAGWVR